MSDDQSDGGKGGCLPREQDYYLPIANISRLMKEALPVECKVGREAKYCMQESVSEFISFITSEASDKCNTEKRKTINGDDILWAMQSLGFDDYLEPLKLFLQRYRNSERASTRRVMSRGPGSDSDSAAGYPPFNDGSAQLAGLPFHQTAVSAPSSSSSSSSAPTPVAITSSASAPSTSS